MEQIYQVGDNYDSITLKITVGTVGVAYSRFSVMKDFKSLKIGGTSKPKSGNIENAVLGASTELKDTIVTIAILIDFSPLNSSQRESAVKALFVEYQLSGGKDEVKNYTFNKEIDLFVSANQKVLSITSQIELI